ncbi:hypothetical protein [Actinomadura rugatobispora]|uniref:ABM domain-containing protein n=1 Tax=Actinomadura rugatobispora TaxID=1994 RepID=A0ABW1AJP5_9ACTN|nr:hypothetical protein GCM10010200_091820 [Actinomadura rugatobispora]
MSVLRITRFQVDAADVEEMVVRRTALISALQRTFPGLAESRLARVDEESWIEVSRWESAAQLQAALERGPALPEAAAAFSLVKDATAESAEVVDVR